MDLQKERIEETYLKVRKAEGKGCFKETLERWEEKKKEQLLSICFLILFLFHAFECCM